MAGIHHGTTPGTAGTLPITTTATPAGTTGDGIEGKPGYSAHINSYSYFFVFNGITSFTTLAQRHFSIIFIFPYIAVIIHKTIETRRIAIIRYI